MRLEQFTLEQRIQKHADNVRIKDPKTAAYMDSIIQQAKEVENLQQAHNVTKVLEHFNKADKKIREKENKRYEKRLAKRKSNVTKILAQFEEQDKRLKEKQQQERKDDFVRKIYERIKRGKRN